MDLDASIPSHDSFNAIFAAIRPADFENRLLSWITSLKDIAGGQIVAIDGKTLRRSFDAASGKSAIHMVSAGATASHITLGQVACDETSTKITEVWTPLETLEIKGRLVTIAAIGGGEGVRVGCFVESVSRRFMLQAIARPARTAMGRQVEIAQQIVGSEADYVLAVKANQKTMYGRICHRFQHLLPDDFAAVRVRKHHTQEKGHGREESRRNHACAAPEYWLDLALATREDE